MRGNNKSNSKTSDKYNSDYTSDIESESMSSCFGSNEIPKFISCKTKNPKNPCPLRSFCDPGLPNTCNMPPCINQCTPKQSVTTWKINYLVSNHRLEAAHYDTDLVQPRSVVIFNNQLWVSNTMSDKITNYDLFGNKLLEAIQVRWNNKITSFPTGLVVNCGSGFPVTSGSGVGARPASLLTATKTGDLVAYNPVTDMKRGYVVIDNKTAGNIAVYTGLAVVGNWVYLADFYRGHINVYNANFNLLGIHGRNFVDNYAADPIPIAYGPHNIVYIPPYLYILYAERDPEILVHHTSGAGKGYISVFNLEGGFIKRFHSGGVLNTPWAMIPAPCECGIPEGALLVGNEGDGRINIFDRDGNFLGPMLSQSGIPIVIPGLQSLYPHYTTFNEIFFTSSIDIENSGLLGSLVKDQVITI